MEDKIIRGDGPTAVESKIGYLLSGPTKKSTNEGGTFMLNILISHKEEEYDLEKFWKIERLGITPQVKENTQKEHLENFISINISYDDTKYSAKLPWKEDHTPLPSNIEITRRRTDNVIRRLRDDQYLLNKYGDIIVDQEQRGFIEKVDDANIRSDSAHYIPYHPVKKESAMTPIRIVYDCSCRQSDPPPLPKDKLSSGSPFTVTGVPLVVHFM